MTPVRFSDAQLADVKVVAAGLPRDLRQRFLEALSAALQGQDLTNADGLIHRAAVTVARALTWDANRKAPD
jgi:hypothetical protein